MCAWDARAHAWWGRCAPPWARQRLAAAFLCLVVQRLRPCPWSRPRRLATLRTSRPAERGRGTRAPAWRRGLEAVPDVGLGCPGLLPPCCRSCPPNVTAWYVGTRPNPQHQGYQTQCGSKFPPEGWAGAVRRAAVEVPALRGALHIADRHGARNCKQPIASWVFFIRLALFSVPLDACTGPAAPATTPPGSSTTCSPSRAVTRSESYCASMSESARPTSTMPTYRRLRPDPQEAGRRKPRTGGRAPLRPAPATRTGDGLAITHDSGTDGHLALLGGETGIDKHHAQ